MNATPAPHRKQLLISLCLAFFMPGCSGHDNTSDNPDRESAKGAVLPRNLLSFPAELQTANQEVNDFLTHAMTVAATGDYDAFRLLWSTKTEPLSKDEFDQGWQAVKTIRILAMEKVKVARGHKLSHSDPEVAYLVCARIEFDPIGRLGRPIENREAICLIEYEQNQWRLANAPQVMRTWLRDRIDSPGSPRSEKQSSQPFPATSGS